MTDLSSQTLHVVAKEMAVTLGEARVSLEAYAERVDQREMLEKCAELLHVAQGVLRLVEVYGAALLAEEMEQVARYLLQTVPEEKRHADGLDSLMRAMVQLPTYLDRVLSGGRDMALILLPLLNDLRAVRGTPLLSEGTLLLLNLKSDQPARRKAPAADEPALDAASLARRLRSKFQLGLLGLIRDDGAAQNLVLMGDVAARLEEAATTQPLFQFWWVTGAVIEALQNSGLQTSATVKRLLGQADRQLKVLSDLGEQRYAENPPVDLLNNLLYCVARAATDTGRVGAVRKSFRLAEMLPVDDSIEQERQSLSAPSVKLMHTVALAIKEDLAKVKDVLDIFVRRGGGQPDELKPQLEMLKKISDTLGVLGLGQLRQRVQDEIAALQQSVADGMPLGDAALVRIAGVLLSVEDNLDDHLVRLILPAAPVDAVRGEEPRGEPDDHEFRQVSEAVLRECIVNLARVKEAVSASVQGSGEGAAPGLDNVPQLLRGITAGLLMLGKSRAVGLMDAVGIQVKRLVEVGAPKPDPQRLERVADAIVSLEYYMETIQSGRADPWYMLDNAEICIRALLDEGPSRLPTLELPPADAAATLKLPTLEPAAATEVLPRSAPSPDTTTPQLGIAAAATPAATPSVPEVASPATVVLAALPAVDTEADPLLIGVFVEEAGEVLASILRTFPLWEKNPGDVDALTTMRRNFHTLKGSGRMVGARLIGDFAWSIENLLNRLLDKTLERTAGMMRLLHQAVDVLPQLIGQIEKGGSVTAPVGEIIAEAYRYAEGRSAEQQETVVQPEEVPAHQPTLVLPSIQMPVADAADLMDSIMILDPAPSPEEVPAHQPTVVLPAIQAPAAAADLPDLVPDFDIFAADERPAPMDPALHEIYSKETANHLEQIRDYLRRRGGLPPPHDLPEPVYRAIHTLSGSSKMADARHGIRLTEPLNHYMRKVYDSGRGLSDAGLVLLADVVAAIERVVSHIDEETGFFGEQPLLRERIARLDAELDAELMARYEDAAPSVRLPPPEEPAPLDFLLSDEELLPAADAADAAGTAGTAAEPDGNSLFELFATGQQLALTEPDAAGAESSAAFDMTPPDEPASAAPPAMPAPPAPPAPPATPVPVDAFDHEIANIYSEEATELLDAAQLSLAAWNANRADTQPFAGLQRHLHTLKGGARMAGIQPMGDLSHELETLVILIDNGTLPGNDRAYAILQASLDELARMRDTVAFGTMPAAATALLAQIRGLTAGELVPEEPEPPAAAPVAAVAAGPTATATPAAAAASVDPAPAAAALPAVPPAAPIAPVAPAAPVAPPAAAGATVDDLDTSRSGEFPLLAADGLAAPVLPGRESQPVERAELARVDAELLDTMLNNAGEVSIFRARLDQQVSSIDFNLAELARTVTRLKEQLRGLEIETEVQVLNRHRDAEPSRTDFDPLELDRYSSIQQFSRALAETAGDVASIQGLLESLARDAQNLLGQQARVITDLQNSLMRTRMVPFQRHVQRLTRLVRQAANDTGKRAELIVQGAAAELDRQSLERMVPPLEHMLRNAVIHGIETPARRAELGKPEAGRITISLTRDGAEVIIVVTDDGAGIDVRLIRDKAVALGLADPGARLTDEEAMQLILEPGFSTAGRVTQAAGRGVGMDVVATEVKKLGGGLFIESKYGEGSRFTIRLPFTLAISQALIVRVAEETYALPLATVEGVVRLPRNIVARHLAKEAAPFEYGGQRYRFMQLGTFVGLGATLLPETDVSMSVVLVRAGEHSTALVADELVGSREIVVKSLGPQISAIRGIAGATILGDGRIVVILDVGALVRSEWRARPSEVPLIDQRDRRTFAMVVDDSITVRRVTQRLLERNGMKVLTAKDGVEAMSLLQDNLPEIILLDIEMPRMDGYEVAANVRADPRLKHIPIVMITSRVSEKHRARAIELGVNEYLGKPYQESQLLDAIEPLVHRRAAGASPGSPWPT
jgi:chemosensory pili system protein ChpA (sensor histidine kinase/response regulator)